jgi:choline kinase
MTSAIILAAGQGTRLRPLTDDKPKGMVPLMGVPLLERQIKTLRGQGVDRIHIVTGYRADKIQVLGLPTSHNERFEKTNMVESLFAAIDFMKEAAQRNDDLVIAYADIVYEPKNLQTLLKTNDEIVLMIDKKWKDLWSVRLENPLDDAETLVLNAKGYVLELGKKPQSYEKIQGQYTGLLKIRSDRLEDFISFYQSLDRNASYDGKNFDNMFMTSFLQSLIDAGWKVKAAMVENGWLEIDSVEDLHHYEKMAKNGELDQFYKLGG